MLLVVGPCFAIHSGWRPILYEQRPAEYDKLAQIIANNNNTDSAVPLFAAASLVFLFVDQATGRLFSVGWCCSKEDGVDGETVGRQKGFVSGFRPLAFDRDFPIFVAKLVAPPPPPPSLGRPRETRPCPR